MRARGSTTAAPRTHRPTACRRPAGTDRAAIVELQRHGRQRRRQHGPADGATGRAAPAAGSPAAGRRPAGARRCSARRAAWSLRHDAELRPRHDRRARRASRGRQALSNVVGLIVGDTDPGRQGQAHPHRRRRSSWAPSREKENDRTQLVRIDHILGLEQGVGGAGVATLAHELLENYEAQAVPADELGRRLRRAARDGPDAENTILAELQDAAGDRPLGRPVQHLSAGRARPGQPHRCTSRPTPTTTSSTRR